MGALRAAAAAFVLLWPTPGLPQSLVDRWAKQIGEASVRFHVPQSWIRKVMAAESGGRTHLGGRPIQSPAGAMGLMQLMPGTWEAMRAAHGLGPDPHDPLDNVLAGTAYLRLMHDRFGYPGLFAAYNAGPARYSAHLRDGAVLPGETRAYVARIAGSSTPALRSPDPSIAPVPAAAGLFVPRSLPSGLHEPAPMSSRGSDGLFVPIAAAAPGR